MINQPVMQRITKTFVQETYIVIWIEAFLIDRKAQNLSVGTIGFYSHHLHLFTEFCDSQVVTQITQIDPSLIREYLIWLEMKGHNPEPRARNHEATVEEKLSRANNDVKDRFESLKPFCLPLEMMFNKKH